MTKPLRIVFAGTPDFAARHLQALIDSEHHIVAVYSQPDRPAGRGKKLKASEVKTLALEHDLPVYQPASLKNSDAQAELKALDADIMVVVAYGLILPKAALEIPRLGCINVHGSILPKWRGAAPIQRAIWAGDKETGVTIMQMDEGLDTGDMINIVTCPIDSRETSATLYTKLAEVGPNALVDTLADIAAGKATATQQNDDDATYARKLSKEEALINWQDDAEHIERCVRAFNPWPISHTVMQGNPVKVWQAECIDGATTAAPGTVLSASKAGIDIATANGALRITQLQPQGKKPMSAQDFLNGRADWVTPGSVLGGNHE